VAERIDDASGVGIVATSSMRVVPPPRSRGLNRAASSLTVLSAGSTVSAAHMH
jgi:hypothetical protein